MRIINTTNEFAIKCTNPKCQVNLAYTIMDEACKQIPHEVYDNTCISYQYTITCPVCGESIITCDPFNDIRRYDYDEKKL